VEVPLTSSYTSDPEAEDHVQFDEHGKIVRGYREKGWDGEGDASAEDPGEILKGFSGEAVRIMKRPGSVKIHFKRLQELSLIQPFFFRRRQDHRARLEEAVR
jgi:hypothetical protein